MLKLVSRSADDSVLVKYIKEGNEQAFRMLVEKHRENVRNLIYLTFGHSNNTDDLAQEVFIKVFKGIERFREDSTFTTWLYRITINVCKDEMRKKKIRQIFTPLEGAAENASYDNMPDRETQHLVRQGIARLPSKLRLPLILKDIKGFSYDEIADMMNIELGTVKSRLYRAREALKEILRPLAKEMS
jgi:RNA polymerase sigma-70 factor (ECF subfamily)